MRIVKSIILAGTLALGAAPAAAEVAELHEDHFITRNEAVVEASTTEVWLALISPSRWWSDEHTWSADAANLTLTPQAGGCFCEKIPEVSEPDRFTLEGSVEHMRVIQAYPEVALRMRGALGPLQSEPVTGILTIAISEMEVDGVQGTRIVWEYNVAGKMRYPLEVISPAVDGVMTLQLTRLADLLGTLVPPAVPSAEPEPAKEGGDASTDAPDDGNSPDDGNAQGEGEPAISIDPEAVIDEGAADEPVESDEDENRGPSVDEAFGDLSDEG